jgi:phage terminase Nu1 subunit (DNA packaging protein)
MDADDAIVTRDRAAHQLRRTPRTIQAAIEDAGLQPVESEPGRRTKFRFGDIKAAVDARLKATADQLRNGQGMSATAGLTAARQRLVENKAQIAELERRRLEDELIEVAEARVWMISAITVIRTRLLALPSKCAARLGMATTLAERHSILKAEIYAMLTDLAGSADEVLKRHQAALDAAHNGDAA